MKKILIALFFTLLVSGVALAAPMPDGFYVNDELEQCGSLWGGDEFVNYLPVDDGWDFMFWEGEWYDAACAQFGDYLGFHAGSNVESECLMLESYGITDTYDPGYMCDVIGYEYIIEMEYEVYDTGFTVEEAFGEKRIAYGYGWGLEIWIPLILIVIFGIIFAYRKIKK